MKLVMNSTAVETTDEQTLNKTVVGKQNKNSTFKIVIGKTYTDPSPMPDHLKEWEAKKAPAMADLFKALLKQKGESPEYEQVDQETIRVSNLSALTLHSLALKAAEFGKDVTYKKETTIIIS